MAHCKGAVKRRALTDGGEQEMSFIPDDVACSFIFSVLRWKNDFPDTLRRV